MPRYRFEDIAINSKEKVKAEKIDQSLYIGLEHLEPGCLSVKSWGSDVPIKGDKLVMHKGDVLFGKRNAYLRRAAIAPHDGAFSAHGMVLRPKENVIDSEFFPLFIASDYFFDAAIRISVGSLSPTVNWKDLKNIEFNIPPIPIQRELSKVLWAINDTKEAYRQLIQDTDELVKSQFIEMFGEVASIVSGITKGRKTKSNVLIQVPYMSTANVKDGHVDWSDVKKIEATPEEIQQYNLMPDDILMTEGGDPDKVGRGCMPGSTPVNCIYQNHIFRVRLNQSKVMAPYFARYITLPRVRAYFLQCSKQTTGIASINKKQLGELPVMFPDIDQQNEYIAFADQSDKSKFVTCTINKLIEGMTLCLRKTIQLSR